LNSKLNLALRIYISVHSKKLGQKMKQALIITGVIIVFGMADIVGNHFGFDIWLFAGIEFSEKIALYSA